MPDEDARVRLIVSKLGASSYACFTNHIRLKAASELWHDGIVKTLKQLFGQSTCIFTRRYIYIRNRGNGEPPSDYTATVNR
ncbi:unnamed protein product [Toxocara canis]|uniref:Transposase n=1 Tax=Toxocara canis TaxID=6265 RepID=A0A183UFV4_TOXCA|nr:unnamed protein product [Toxocara canis]